MKCRHCESPLQYVFVDLGFAPPSNAYLTAEDLQKPEITFPLKVYVCDQCWLVQTADFADRELLFSKEYAYFSSTSSSWLTHAKEYCESITSKLNLTNSSFVVEIASNDGYLLKNFVEQKIPCLGIEPTQSTADAARKLQIPVIEEFFGENLAKRVLEKSYPKADLICGNNVYAHVPDINDFTRGLKTLLNSNGTVTLEFPHLLNLIRGSQFDTIYHEHYSYLSLIAVDKIFKSVGLSVYDVEELSTHGGSLRIYGCHSNSNKLPSEAVGRILAKEIEFGLDQISTYTDFQDKVIAIKNQFNKFLIEQKSQGKKIAAYGAAAKGNTLLNYAGVKTDLIDFVCDAAKAKQHKYMPGSHIPIYPPQHLLESKPDLVIIFPWNLLREISNDINVHGWGGKFIVAVPEIQII